MGQMIASSWTVSTNTYNLHATVPLRDRAERAMLQTECKPYDRVVCGVTVLTSDHDRNG
jgi:hypothetical protein